MADAETSRGRLSKDLIVEAAVLIADHGGLEAVSMRAVASSLGVTAMSLYKHVANKDDLIGGMLDRVITEIERPKDVDWKTAIRTSSQSTRAVLLRHGWASSLWLTRTGGAGQARLHYADWLLRTLRGGGLPATLVYHAYHILESYVLGSTLQELNFSYEDEERTAMVENFLEDLPAIDFPDMAEHARRHIEPHESGLSGVELALDLLLDGLERAAGEM